MVLFFYINSSAFRYEYTTISKYCSSFSVLWFSDIYILSYFCNFFLLQRKMSTKHDFISNVSPRKQSWTLVVRVVRAWFVQDYKNKKLPFLMKLVLMDRNVLLSYRLCLCFLFVCIFLFKL